MFRAIFRFCLDFWPISEKLPHNRSICRLSRRRPDLPWAVSVSRKEALAYAFTALFWISVFFWFLIFLVQNLHLCFDSSMCTPDQTTMWNEKTGPYVYWFHSHLIWSMHRRIEIEMDLLYEKNGTLKVWQTYENTKKRICQGLFSGNTYGPWEVGSAPTQTTY